MRRPLLGGRRFSEDSSRRPTDQAGLAALRGFLARRNGDFGDGEGRWWIAYVEPSRSFVVGTARVAKLWGSRAKRLLSGIT